MTLPTEASKATISYLSMPGVSRSMLRLFDADPYLYYLRHVARSHDSPPPTDAMRIGTATEDLLFTGDISNVVFIPKEVLNEETDKATGRVRYTRRGKAYKEWLAQQPDGAEILKYTEYAAKYAVCSAMVDQIRACPTAVALTVEAANEFGTYHETLQGKLCGLLCKAEVDVIDTKRRIIVDFKTASDVTPRAFARDADKYWYDAQAWLYTELWRQHTDTDYDFVFVVGNKTPSHQPAIYQPSPAMMDRGRHKVMGSLSRLADLLDDWNQPTDGDRPWRNPDWGTIVTIDPPYVDNRWKVANDE